MIADKTHHLLRSSSRASKSPRLHQLKETISPSSSITTRSCKENTQGGEANRSFQWSSCFGGRKKLSERTSEGRMESSGLPNLSVEGSTSEKWEDFQVLRLEVCGRSFPSSLRTTGADRPREFALTTPLNLELSLFLNRNLPGTVSTTWARTSPDSNN